MNEKEIGKPTWHFIITDWRAKRAKTETPAFLLCVNRYIMVGRIKTFGVMGRWQWARYECDQKDYTWFGFFLYHWFVYSISVCFVIKRWQWLHRMMWHFSRVTVRVQHKSVQTHKTTNRSINRFVYQIHQVVTQKKQTERQKKDNIHAIPSWGFFYMYVKCKTHRRIKRQMVEKIYLLKMWFDRL